MTANQKRLAPINVNDGKGESIIEREYHFDAAGKKIDKDAFPGLVRYTVSARSIREARAIVARLHAGASIEGTNAPNSDKQREKHELVDPDSDTVSTGEILAYDTPAEMLAHLRHERKERCFDAKKKRVAEQRATQAAKRAARESAQDS